MGYFGFLMVNGILIGGVYALVALGMVLIYKSSSVLNLAQGNFLSISAYLCWTFLVEYDLPLSLSFLITGVILCLLAIIIERFTLRPLIGQPILATIVMTIALGVALEGGEILVWGGDVKGFPPFIPHENVVVGGYSLSQGYIWCFGISLIVFICLVILFKFTRVGLAMRAVADDQEAALSQGISVKKIFVYSWAFAALVGGTGGILLGSIYAVSDGLAATGIAKALPVLLLGGLESVPGAFVGGLIIGIVEMLGAGYIDPLVGGGFKDILPFIVMLIFLLARPYGLFGQIKIERV